MSHGEYVDGLSSIAAPVLDRDGHAIAALLAHGPSYRFPSAVGEQLAEQTLIEAARALTDLVTGS